MNKAYTNNRCKMVSDEGRKKLGKVGFQNFYIKTHAWPQRPRPKGPQILRTYAPQRPVDKNIWDPELKNIKNINPPEGWDPGARASGIKNIKNINPPRLLGD